MATIAEIIAQLNQFDGDRKVKIEDNKLIVYDTPSGDWCIYFG